GTNTLTRPGFVVITNSPPPPMAAFNASRTNGSAPLALTFTDTSTGTITNRFWNFGNGVTTNTSATSFSFIYAAPGTNTVSLTVLGPSGTNTLTRPGFVLITTSPPPPTSPPPFPTPLSAYPTNGSAPLALTFTDTSTGAITNRFWNFGNGVTTNTSATNFSFIYSAPGTNTVSLTVRGPFGTNTLTRSG